MERDFIVASPLISRHKPVFVSAVIGVASSARAADPALGWSLGRPSASEPAWLAIAVGPGAKRVLVNWAASGTDYDDVRSGAPAAYRIESSASSTNGSDGVWRVEVDVSDNRARACAHELEFDGQSWVRWVVTAAPRESLGVKIEALDVHDATDGTDDTWLFLGDPQAGAAFARNPPQPSASFARQINELYPAYYPAVIDASISGESITAAIERLDRVLAHHPHFRHVVIAYGAHDAAGGLLSAAQYSEHLRTLVDRLEAAGRQAILGPPLLGPMLTPVLDATFWAEATDYLYAPH